MKSAMTSCAASAMCRPLAVWHPADSAASRNGVTPCPAIKLTVDDHPPEHFAVIAGIGVDAMIMDETDSGLKDEIGSAAYFLAAANALGRTPIRLTVQLDHHRPVKRRAMICAIANVGKLASKVTLIP
jgi:diacylglycerol kinase (ATP)